MAGGGVVKKPDAKLVREWYDRLRAEGFHDVESPMRERMTGDALEHRKVDSDKGEYLDRARAFLRDHDFGHELDRAIWEMHAEGESEKAICRRFFGSTSGGTRRKVARVLTRLRAEMEGKTKKRGRKRKPEGRGTGTLRGHTRYSDAEAAAVFFIAEQLGVARARRTVAGEVQRLCVAMVAELLRRGISVDKITGAR
jgi:uncharacterized protein with von Willebrand factor type A (vWA) domain